MTALFNKFDNRYQIYEDAEKMAIFFEWKMENARKEGLNFRTLGTRAW